MSKYADYCPLFHQSQIYARSGLNIDRSTLANWMGKVSFCLAPVVDKMLKELKTSSKLFADETCYPVLYPGRGKTKTGYLWAIPFDGWTEVFGSERLTRAVLDRLTHHVHITKMNGESYRLKYSRKNRTKIDYDKDVGPTANVRFVQRDTANGAKAQYNIERSVPFFAPRSGPFLLCD